MTDRTLNASLFAVALISIIAASLIGSTPISFGDFIRALLGNSNETYTIIVWEIRIPRAIAAFLVGGALGLSGAALQGLLRNPLAEPGVLGVSATASLFATLVIFYGVAGSSQMIISVAAITGALCATAALVIASLSTQSVTMLILFGVAVSSFAGAVMVLLLNLAPNPFALSDMVNWTLGSVANRSAIDISRTLPFLLIGAGFLFFARRDLAALTLGEIGAIAIGANVKKTRLMIISGTGILTGAAVALAGAIGFVGIVAPHIIRPLVGYNPQRLLLPSALTGGIILVLADMGVRLIPTPNELKLGVVAALIGAPAFAWIAIRQSKKGQL